jgi:hypothetical protein
LKRVAFFVEEDKLNNAGTNSGSKIPLELIFHEVHEHGVSISDQWMQEVEKRSLSQVHFTKFTGPELKFPETADAARDVPAQGGRYLLLDLIQMPFITPNSVVGSKVVAQLYKEFAEMRSELNDVKVAGLGTGSIMAIFSSQKWGPVRKMEDLKGARTRSLLPIDKGIAALGAIPLHVEYLKIPHLLANGELDATILGLLPAKQFKLSEGIAPYCTVAADRTITTHPMRLSIKWETWNRLPSGVQKAVDELGPAGGDCWFATRCGPDFDAHLVAALEDIKRHGELITLTRQELDRWIKVMQPAIETTLNAAEASGLPGKRFYARMLELVRLYSDMG